MLRRLEFDAEKSTAEIPMLRRNSASSAVNRDDYYLLGRFESASDCSYRPARVITTEHPDPPAATSTAPQPPRGIQRTTIDPDGQEIVWGRRARTLLTVGEDGVRVGQTWHRPYGTPPDLRTVPEEHEWPDQGWTAPWTPRKRQRVSEPPSAEIPDLKKAEWRKRQVLSCSSALSHSWEYIQWVLSNWTSLFRWRVDPLIGLSVGNTAEVPKTYELTRAFTEHMLTPRHYNAGDSGRNRYLTGNTYGPD